jgi:hypothetical protein
VQQKNWDIFIGHFEIGSGKGHWGAPRWSLDVQQKYRTILYGNFDFGFVPALSWDVQQNFIPGARYSFTVEHNTYQLFPVHFDYYV